jgi:hypothetical protein
MVINSMGFITLPTVPKKENLARGKGNFFIPTTLIARSHQA